MADMIDIRGVTKRFGDFVAVNDISLTVQQGEFVTLLGPSGCGKTTLLRMLSGFEAPTTGRLLIGGADVTDLPPYRRDVNQVFQSYALFPHLTVEQNIAFGLRMLGLRKPAINERVSKVIELVALQGLEQRRPNELSGGQRQRVALARAIVPEPKVLLLDEPLSALDAKLRRAMQLELKRLQRHLGLTMVFVTHDQEEALTLSDRVAVMNRGRIEQLGTANAVYHRPATRFVADFLGESNLLSAVIRTKGDGRVVGCTPEGLELVVDGCGAEREEAQVTLSIRPESVRVSRKPLDHENGFEGSVVERIFQGANDRLSLLTPQGTRLTAIIPNAEAQGEVFQRGERVHCTLPVENIVVLRESAPVLGSV